MNRQFRRQFARMSEEMTKLGNKGGAKKLTKISDKKKQFVGKQKIGKWFSSFYRNIAGTI